MPTWRVPFYLKMGVQQVTARRSLVKLTGARQMSFLLLVTLRIVQFTTAQPVDVPTVATLANSTQCLFAVDVAVRPSDGAVIAACQNGGVIQVLNGTVTTLATSEQCLWAASVSIRPSDGAVIAGCPERGVILVLNATLTNLTNDAQCPQPVDMAVRPSDGAVIAACRGSGVIQVLNGRVTTLTTSAQCPDLRGVSVRPSDGAVIAACYNGGVIQVLNKTVTTLANSTQCPKPIAVAVRPSDGAVIAACVVGGVIQVLNATVTTLATSTQCYPKNVAVRPSDGAVIASCGDGGVIHVLNKTVTTLATTAQCPDPKGVAVRPSDGAVIAAGGTGGVIAIDTSCAGGFFLSNGQCQPCAAGFASRDQSLAGTLCVPCQPGFIMPLLGALDCDPVPRGFFDPGFLPRVSFFPCFLGQFSQSAATTCSACSGGRYQNSTNASACALCDAGRFSGSNAVACIECAPVQRDAWRAVLTSKRVRVMRVMRVVTLDAGLLCRRNGLVTVRHVRHGSPRRGLRLVCMRAVHDRLLRGLGRQRHVCAVSTGACVRRPTTSGDAIASGPLRRCHGGQGSIANQSGAAACSACQAGTFSGDRNSTACSACDVGRYVSFNGSAVCMECPPVGACGGPRLVW
jgi:hypothetical protein